MNLHPSYLILYHVFYPLESETVKEILIRRTTFYDQFKINKNQ